MEDLNGLLSNLMFQLLTWKKSYKVRLHIHLYVKQINVQVKTKQNVAISV